MATIQVYKIISPDNGSILGHEEWDSSVIDFRGFKDNRIAKYGTAVNFSFAYCYSE